MADPVVTWAALVVGDPVYDAKTHSVVGWVRAVEPLTFRVEWAVTPVEASYVVRVAAETGRRVNQPIPSDRGQPFALREMP